MDWTFGIITDGKSDDRLKLIIESILIQEYIGNSEIIVIGGNSPQEKIPLLRFIPFDENPKPNHITKKKNLIAQNAKYQNILLLHDYIALNPFWTTKFNKFGEDWDVCVNRILMKDGTRFRDFITWDNTLAYNNGLPHSHTIRYVDYNDHSQIRNQYVSGAAYCIKKNFALKYPLNECKSWAESEDVEFSIAVRSFWNLKCNPYSILHFLKEKEIWPPRRNDYNWKENGGI
jgi:hypothetical protein